MVCLWIYSGLSQASLDAQNANVQEGHTWTAPSCGHAAEIYGSVVAKSCEVRGAGQNPVEG